MDATRRATNEEDGASAPTGPTGTEYQKWERCIQKWNSLLAEHIIINEPERAEGSEEAEGARQVGDVPRSLTPAREIVPYRNRLRELICLKLAGYEYRPQGIFSSAPT